MFLRNIKHLNLWVDVMWPKSFVVNRNHWKGSNSRMIIGLTWSTSTSCIYSACRRNRWHGYPDHAGTLHGTCFAFDTNRKTWNSLNCRIPGNIIILLWQQLSWTTLCFLPFHSCPFIFSSVFRFVLPVFSFFVFPLTRTVFPFSLVDSKWPWHKQANGITS